MINDVDQPEEAAAPVLIDTRDGVTTITLNRPKAMNGLDIATKEALLAAVDAAASDDTVRCVVLTGVGRGFCVGQDLKEHLALLNGDGAESLFRTVEEHYNPIVTALATMPKPVVAALNGVAAGAGASLALACDFRLVAESAGFNFAFSGVALSCDTGSSWTLPRLIGAAKAIDLLYFPRTVGAAESLDLGLASRVVADDELAAAAGELAERLAKGPTVAYGAIRRAVSFSAGHDLAASLQHEGEMMTLTGSTEDHRAAVDAFVAKRTPEFNGR
ncbi:MAG TPA: enoyl-CoA hydratase-related protein [Marmoricola sp.]